jgi:mitochondrial inner membrane protein COX18
MLKSVVARRFISKPTLILQPSSIHVNRRQFSQSFWNDISNSAPVCSMQEAIHQLHDVTGLPWWSTIIVSTVLLRGVITFPLSIYQSKVLAKVEKISSEMPEIVKELKIETSHAIRKFNWNEQQARAMYNRSLKKQWDNLVIRDNCHPMKASIVIIFQIPLWLTQSWALRNLIYMQPDPTSIKAQMAVSEMLVGGFGFVPNLTEIDHSLILPITLGVLNLTIIEVNKRTLCFYRNIKCFYFQIQKMSKKIQVNTKFQTYATNFFRILSIGMIPIAAFVPSGLCLYWVSSSAFGLVQNLLLLSPRLKRMTNIPKVNSELDKPYSFIVDRIKERIGK